MNTTAMETINEFFQQQHPVVPGLIVAILFGLFILFSLSPWRQLFTHWRLQHLVKKLGIASLKNVYIPDGLGDYIYIEQLILQPDGLLFLSIKPFRGNIFAADQIDLWTQVVGHRSYKFPNPIHQQEADLQALRGMLDKQKITSLVVFAKGSQFPKGKPEGVCDYEQLKSLGQQVTRSEVRPDLKTAWDEIAAKAEPATNMKQAILFRKEDRRGLIYGLIFLACSMAILVQYLMHLYR